MIDSAFTCHANGKLLLSGEYFVLDGALALAVPTIFGQHFTASPLDGPNGFVEWSSLDKDGDIWFQCRLQAESDFEVSYKICSATDNATAIRIAQILHAAAELNPDLLNSGALKVAARLDFPLDWGLGSSSTLIYMVSKWLDISPFDLLESTFSGSGYDIACAGANGPIFYQRIREVHPSIQPVKLDWPFKENLHFVYLENKQDSRDGIWHYQNHLKGEHADYIEKVSDLSRKLASAKDLEEFTCLLDAHEKYIAETLDLARVKNHRFEDFKGSIKSLGAWGGDFVLAASTVSSESVKKYFNDREYNTVLSWNELILE